MKKYLAILLTLAMTACVVTPTPDPGPVGPPEDPAVDAFILNARGTYKLGTDKVQLVDTVVENKYKAGDMIKSGDSIAYEYQKQYTDTRALYLNTTSSKYNVVEYDASIPTIKFLGDFTTPAEGDTAEEDSATTPILPSPDAPIVEAVDPFELENDATYQMHNERSFKVELDVDGKPSISENGILLYSYVKGLNETQAIFVAGTDKFVGIEKYGNNFAFLNLYVKDGKEDATWTTANAVRFTERHIYKQIDSGQTTVKRLVSMVAQFTGAPLVARFGKDLGGYFPYTASRIPVIYTLSNGTVLAGGDARRNGNGDSANDIDSFIRISKDHGKSWSVPIYQHYNDDSDHTRNPLNRRSSSYIDSTLGQATNGTVLSMVNGFKSGGGIQGGIGRPAASPFIDINGKRYLLLVNKDDVPDPVEKPGPGNAAIDQPDQIKKFTNVVLLGEVVLGGKDGLTPTEVKPLFDDTVTRRSRVRGLSIDMSDGTGGAIRGNVTADGSDKWEIDEYWQIWKDGKQVKMPQINNTANMVFSSVNYGGEAQFRSVNNTYAFMAYSENNGEVWEKSKDVSWHFRTSAGEGIVGPKINEQPLAWSGESWADPAYLARYHYIVSPGRLHTMTTGTYEGRVFSALYTHFPTERALIVYSDDNGITWERGGIIANIATSGPKLSETQLVEASDGTVLAFGRTGGNIAMYQSTDGGDTWNDGWDTGLKDASINNGAMITPLNLKYTTGFKGQELLAMSHSDKHGRENGVVRITELKKNESGEWRLLYNSIDGTDIIDMTTYVGNDANHALNWSFAYSAITELANGDIGLLSDGNGANQLEYYNIGLERK